MFWVKLCKNVKKIFGEWVECKEIIAEGGKVGM